MNDRYEQLELIGAGGMGTVYKGRDTQTGAFVAIKHLKPQTISANPTAITRFRREGELLHDLRHPNIVEVLHTDFDPKDPVIVMAYLPGGSLQDLIGHRAPMPVVDVLNIALEVADALTRAHHLNILHRDLKPANVMLNDDLTPCLTDFGLAYVRGGEHLTDSQEIVGTLPYMSPEALKGSEADEKTDIWAFGVMLYEMLAGIRPFRGDLIEQMMWAIVMETPEPDLEVLRPDVPVALIDLIYRMLTKVPAERIPSMRLVGAEIESVLRGRALDTGSRTERKSEAQEHEPTLIVKERFASATPTHDRSKHNLPLQTTAFVGREGELHALADLLTKPDIRLITILGPGGMGKTRLALETATRQVNHSPDGVYFVELAPLASPDSIPSAIAEATDYTIQQDERTPRQQVIDFLSDKRLLLVLDNFEHLLEGVEIVTDILQIAPQVTIIATSRQRLNQTGETVFTLGGMDFPDWETSEDALEFSAVKLFVQSARRVQPDFELEVENLEHVALICQLVQGMPLGIILAAAWLNMLTPGEIVEEIRHSLDFLDSQITDLPQRQRSIRAVFEYSWELLNEQERDSFMKLSVFRGGFTRQAAQSVTGAGLRTLQALVNKSLLQRNVESGRYFVHELLRQYGEEALDNSGQADAIRDAHAQHYLVGVAKLEADLKGRRQRGAIDDVATDLENIRTAWAWAVQQEQDDLIYDAVETLFHFYDFYGNVPDYMALRQQALAVFGGRTRGRLLRGLPGSPEASQKADVDEALRIAQDQDDRHEIARCLIISGFAWFGSEPQAIENLQQGLEICREIGDAFYESQALGWLGYQMGLAEQYESAVNYDSEAIEIARREGNLNWLSQYLTDRAGWAMLATPDYSAVAASIDEARAICVELNMPVSVMYADHFLCIISWLQGDFAGSQAIASKSLQLAKPTGIVNAYYWHTLNFLALALCMQEKYDEAEAYALEAASHVHQEWRAAVYFSMLAQACIHCGLNRPQRIQQAIRDYMKEYDMITVYVYYIAPVMAFLSANNGQYVEATQLLSAAMHNPWNPRDGWLDKWAAVSRLRADLLETLGEEVYQSTWERGQSLDLETTVRELLAEFGEEQDDQSA